MNSIKNTEVAAKSRDGKKIKVGEEWFSAFSPSTLSEVNTGDFVSFDFYIKGDWKNIKGTVKKEGSVVETITDVKSNPPKFAKGNFPIHPLDGQRSICRQNALTNALTFISLNISITGAHEPISTDDVLATASVFEAYTAGDSDREAAENELAELTKVIK